jgi:Holliday junction DNA helicase RuvA
MIAFLSGKLAYLTRDSVILDVNSVGYEVRVSERTRLSLHDHPEGEILQLTTHLIVREDGMELFGFSSPQEKELFLLLTKVSSVGPRTALNVFSTLSLEEIVRAIVGNQPKVLSAAPGIGAKTAQRIILELREKLLKLQLALPEDPGNDLIGIPSDWLEELEMTLLALGFGPEEIQRALHDQGPLLREQTSVDDAIRLMLSRLGSTGS